MNWLKALLADANGIADDARLNAFFLIITFCGATIFALYKGQTWNPQEFGIGAAGLAGGLGAWFGFRKDN